MGMNKTMKLKDVMGNHKSAEIRCPIRGEVVRRLTVNGLNLHFDAITESIDLPLDTELFYQPWVFDRGSILFKDPQRGDLKFCTEWDLIKFEDGTEQRVSMPSDLYD